MYIYIYIYPKDYMKYECYWDINIMIWNLESNKEI